MLIIINCNFKSIFRCTVCDLWICGTCVVLIHRQPPNGTCNIVSLDDALKAGRKALEEMMKSCSSKMDSVESEVNAQVNKLNTLIIRSQKNIDDLSKKLVEEKLNRKQLQEDKKKLNYFKEKVKTCQKSIVGFENRKDKILTEDDIKNDTLCLCLLKSDIDQMKTPELSTSEAVSLNTLDLNVVSIDKKILIMSIIL